MIRPSDFRIGLAYAAAIFPSVLGAMIARS
jgi:hypothetical protein